MLPSFRPTSRTFSVGKRSMSMNDWQGITVSPRDWGSVATTATIRASYRNIPEDDAALFLDNYNATLSGTLPETLSAELKAGIDNSTFTTLLSGNWYYTNPPQVEAVIDGIVNVSIELDSDFIPGSSSLAL